MTPFKHLKSGMSLIEVIAAIAVLAIFGSSLFIMQQFLFERMSISQQKLIANMRMQSELIFYQTNILKEMLAQSGSIDKNLKQHVKNFSKPDMTVTINSVSDFGEASFKKFKNIHLITVQADFEEKEYGKSYSFMYIPEVTQQ